MDAGHFVEELAAKGRYHFTTADTVAALGGLPIAAKAAIHRLREKGRIATPFRGFHVVVPPEYRTLRCLPADPFVPQLMDHLGLTTTRGCYRPPACTVRPTRRRWSSRPSWPAIGPASVAAGCRSTSSPAPTWLRSRSCRRTRSGPIGGVLDAIQRTLDPWLGVPRRVVLPYRMTSEGQPPVPLRLKVEINSREHFTVFGIEERELVVRSGARSC